MSGAPLDDARSAFEGALHRAITEGRSPSRADHLSAAAWTAIDAVAREHPDALVGLIADAYDAFEVEGRAVA